MIISIDPGKHTGWALWSGLRLIDCGLGDPRECPSHISERLEHVWIESPMLYGGHPRPNDIVLLARCAGEYAGRYRLLGAEVHYVFPAVWKGQVPKPVHHARLWSSLSEDQRKLVYKRSAKRLREPCGDQRDCDHNVLDAVALGLWAQTDKEAMRKAHSGAA